MASEEGEEGKLSMQDSYLLLHGKDNKMELLVAFSHKLRLLAKKHILIIALLNGGEYRRSRKEGAYRERSGSATKSMPRAGSEDRDVKWNDRR